MRIAITGADGRMGRMLIEAVLNHPELTLTVALDRAGSSSIGVDAGAFLGRDTGILISDDLALLENADCLIDFTRPAGTLAHLDACVAHHTNCIIGTTGFSDDEKDRIRQASESIAIVFAPNMSVGVNATLRLLEVAAKLMNSGFDVEVFEAHHRNKVDAPSGTALAMGETVANAWGKDLNDIADWARHGDTGARETGHIGFSVVRGGDIIGDHTVYFCGDGERIEISHRSSSRTTYAQGSMRAAQFLAGKQKGLYSMQDVLGIN
ncbi:4-hydroxy-tetrahydrodipicolinate reductase [Paenalcaligenes niemegkensis]|uniref:4-hydroxy-tetrahydrodipicolinate reductase n=1 Tax=Paenalcaligenes niemegkensis TaxID=2895469 RepID=UPI001EE81107|nr:4-hydroxy-tetrahydrodipicolinate reductase [Paenalcaligenes niemegkensis]MCQ9617011.1 4-hydroxy-tetrahydrodipicolinate reductase [Paenalcaligenes niemegkensis]